MKNYEVGTPATHKWVPFDRATAKPGCKVQDITAASNGGLFYYVGMDPINERVVIVRRVASLALSEKDTSALEMLITNVKTSIRKVRGRFYENDDGFVRFLPAFGHQPLVPPMGFCRWISQPVELTIYNSE